MGAQNYMMKQSLWNMERQVSQLKGLITPQTRLMAWQPYLIAQAQRDVQNVYNSMAYSNHLRANRGHSYGGYGAYGGSCGTFLRITGDAAKKACILEKDIAKHKECCEKDCSWWSGIFTVKGGNQENQCRKMAEKQAELDLIMAQEYGPTTIEQATDTEMAKWRAQEPEAEKDNKKAETKLKKTLIITGGSILFVILGIAILR